jgi:hypothetical protein
MFFDKSWIKPTPETRADAFVATIEADLQQVHDRETQNHPYESSRASGNRGREHRDRVLVPTYQPYDQSQSMRDVHYAYRQVLGSGTPEILLGRERCSRSYQAPRRAMVLDTQYA